MKQRRRRHTSKLTAELETKQSTMLVQFSMQLHAFDALSACTRSVYSIPLFCYFTYISLVQRKCEWRCWANNLVAEHQPRSTWHRTKHAAVSYSLPFSTLYWRSMGHRTHTTRKTKSERKNRCISFSPRNMHNTLHVMKSARTRVPQDGWWNPKTKRRQCSCTQHTHCVQRQTPGDGFTSQVTRYALLRIRIWIVKKIEMNGTRRSQWQQPVLQRWWDK